MYPYYDLTISLLLDTETPVAPIWRRFLIATTSSFLDLHKSIQVACGWQDYHLFHFQRRPGWGPEAEIFASSAAAEYEDIKVPPPPAISVNLTRFLGRKPGRTIIYLYDFGDGWEHEVKVNEIVSLPYKFKRALLDGARAFPPEDCGGASGYEECVSVFNLGRKEAGVASGKIAWLGDKAIERDYELSSRRDWLGNWNPEAFDLTKAKRKFDR